MFGRQEKAGYVRSALMKSNRQVAPGRPFSKVMKNVPNPNIFLDKAEKQEMIWVADPMGLKLYPNLT